MTCLQRGSSIRRVGGILLASLAAGTAPLAAQYPTEPPPAAPLSPIRFPPFREARLANRMELVLVENHELPVVSVSLTMPVGAVNDPRGMEGLAGAVAELLTKGTETRTAEEIAATIEGVGGSLTAGASDDFFTITSTVLTDHVELAFELMADVLLRATFPENELELARRRTLSALRLEKSDPGALANRAFAQALYGNHPYSRQPSETSVQAITRDTVVQWAQRHLLPAGALLVIAGDLDLAAARRLADRHFGAWRGVPPEREYGAAPTAGPTEIILVHRPGSEQANIVMGNLALRPGEPTYYAATVTNKFLGGGTDARLFQILREQKGWTYGSYSSVVRRRDLGYFRATAEVRTEVTDSALGELLAQLRRVRGEPAPAAELEAAKSYLTGSFPRQIETPQQIASQVSVQKRLDLGADYLTRYRERVAAVTAREAQQAARQVIRPDSAVIVVVGDGVALYEKLQPFGSVRMLDPDGNPLTAADLKPPATAITFDVSQLVARRDSFRVVVQGNPMGTYVTELATETDLLVFTETVAIPVIGMQQSGRISMSSGDLAMRALHQTMSMGGQTGATDLTFSDGRVTGTAMVPPEGPGGALATRHVDTTLATGVYETNQVQALIPAMPLDVGARFTLQAYNAIEHQVRTLSIVVEGTEEVTVPAGTFQTFRISLTGGESPSILYVSRDAPRRVVRLELVGQPFVFELVR